MNCTWSGHLSKASLQHKQHIYYNTFKKRQKRYRKGHLLCFFWDHCWSVFYSATVWIALTKVSFFVLCSKMQLITLQNFHIQTYFSQFLWFVSLKCWFKGILRIQRFPLSMSILGQKACILGPTIFKIPQPNWQEST